MEFDARELYEKEYGGRGEMENRIKEQQLDLYADRTSAGTIRSNQLRLWFSTLAYLLMNQLRRVALPGTELARATCGTLRLAALENRGAGAGERAAGPGEPEQRVAVAGTLWTGGPALADGPSG